jgi:hypothetical protein
MNRKERREAMKKLGFKDETKLPSKTTVLQAINNDPRLNALMKRDPEEYSHQVFLMMLELLTDNIE